MIVNKKKIPMTERNAIKTVIVCCNYASGLKTSSTYRTGHKNRCCCIINNKFQLFFFKWIKDGKM